MPIYEYRRPNGTTFEVMQRMTDDPLTHDPETGVPVERVFHPVAVHFKGKGFYNTDYGTKRRNRELRESAESGADMLNKLISVKRMPDLIVSDYRLKAGENGIDVVARLREEFNAQVPALLITGDTGMEQLREAEESGLHVLHKPLNPSRLRALIANLRRERTLRTFSRPVNLARFDPLHWMTTEKPIWFIVYHLLEIPHTKLLRPGMARRLRRIDERLFRGEVLGKALKSE